MHYTEDELLDRLYEVGRADNHLEHCEPCRARWEDLLRRRHEMLQPPPISDAWLGAQRALFRERSARPGPLRPALAFAMVALLAFLLTRPAERPAAVLASGDAQLLSEIYQLIEDEEPRGAMPVHGLFEEQE